MWERRMELEGFAAVMETVRNNAAGLKGRAIAGAHDYEQIPALVERGRQRVADFYLDLESRLAESPFVAGERFSAADTTAIVTVDETMLSPWFRWLSSLSTRRLDFRDRALRVAASKTGDGVAL
jgi:glutathione S-transferase